MTRALTASETLGHLRASGLRLSTKSALFRCFFVTGAKLGVQVVLAGRIVRLGKERARVQLRRYLFTSNCNIIFEALLAGEWNIVAP